jgi:predicted nucleic acid-binding protein
VLLVDTSVWVEFFRRPNKIDLESLAAAEEFVTCPPVIQEVLQGFREERAYRTARDAMLALPVLESPMEIEVFLEAAELYRRAGRAGVTVRSSVDCLIAACALRHDIEVYHFDRDYDALSRVAALRVRRLRI